MFVWRGVFKLVRAIFFLLFVTVGLYFFGDFRINDVNVKDYLQSRITAENFRKIKQQVLVVYKGVHKLIDEFDPDLNVETETDTDKTETIQTLIPKQSVTTNTIAADVEKVPLENLYKHEKQQVLKLIQNNLQSSDQTSKP